MRVISVAEKSWHLVVTALAATGPGPAVGLRRSHKVMSHESPPDMTSDKMSEIRHLP
jgi:hypothetical protein